MGRGGSWHSTGGEGVSSRRWCGHACACMHAAAPLPLPGRPAGRRSSAAAIHVSMQGAALQWRTTAQPAAGYACGLPAAAGREQQPPSPWMQLRASCSQLQLLMQPPAALRSTLRSAGAVQRQRRSGPGTTCWELHGATWVAQLHLLPTAFWQPHGRARGAVVLPQQGLQREQRRQRSATACYPLLQPASLQLRDSQRFHHTQPASSCTQFPSCICFGVEGYAWAFCAATHQRCCHTERLPAFCTLTRMPPARCCPSATLQVSEKGLMDKTVA